jgi:hypothetical protein
VYVFQFFPRNNCEDRVSPTHKNGSAVELAQSSEYYLKLTYSNLPLYIPGRTQGNTKPKHCHVVLKIRPMLYFHKGIHRYRGTETFSPKNMMLRVHHLPSGVHPRCKSLVVCTQPKQVQNWLHPRNYFDGTWVQTGRLRLHLRTVRSSYIGAASAVPWFGWVVCAVVVGGGCGCGGSVSRYYLDKNDNFACHVTFAG